MSNATKFPNPPARPPRLERSPARRSSRLVALLLLTLSAAPLLAGSATSTEVALTSQHLRFQLSPHDGRYTITDLRTGTAWQSNPYQPRFGEATVEIAGQRMTQALARCEVNRAGRALEALFHPLANQPEAWLRVRIRLVAPDTLEFAYEAAPALAVRSLRLLDHALGVTDGDRGSVLVPVREGLLIPADSGVSFTHGFDTYAYEGCHLAMLGVLKQNTAALLTWEDPYVRAEVRSALGADTPARQGQHVSVSLLLSKSARSFRLRLLGSGDYVAVARAYRETARQRGWLVPWPKKLAGHPERAKLFGAINYKLWSTLDRRMNADSTREERVQVNWTFDEAAQVAEHLRKDLQLEHVLFLLGGWIHRGYDNQHPDILPAAPECGGDAALADCARRVRALGYVFGLHDNYQDIYRDSPSWDEGLIMKAPDGNLVKGGLWAGGRAYMTCSRPAVALAQRPQNLPAVRQLTQAGAYFIDTTFAAGLQECFDPAHPLTRRDDMKWKQALSDYARREFGIFGSECGREWAIPHSDFFEGLSGVTGAAYHDTSLLQKTGGVVVPLFELVYRDCIALYGKYGYDPYQAAEYVLQHLIFGRPLNYHSIPSHLYWKNPAPAPDQLAVHPCQPETDVVGRRELRISYQWLVDQPPGADWEMFVHFTDYRGTNVFQNDHAPRTPTSQWRPGRMESGWFTLHLPETLRASLDVRVGWWQPASGKRALLVGESDGTRRYLVGRLDLTDTGMQFLPPDPATGVGGGDPAMFVRADQGWAAGLHPFDRFVKNTYELLSPLYELTATWPMTQHEYATADRRVQHSVFGRGRNAVVVTVNLGKGEVRCLSQTGGQVLLPPYGFLVDSPTFVALHARTWKGVTYVAPVFFTLRSLDGKALARSGNIRVFHGFGSSPSP